MRPSTGDGPGKVRTTICKLAPGHKTHYVVQSDERKGNILEHNLPVTLGDVEEAENGLRLVDAIYKALKTGGKINCNY